MLGRKQTSLQRAPKPHLLAWNLQVQGLEIASAWDVGLLLYSLVPSEKGPTNSWRGSQGKQKAGELLQLLMTRLHKVLQTDSRGCDVCYKLMSAAAV